MCEDKATTKLRVMFDGSAKGGLKDQSLNDCLEKGPSNISHIFDIMMRFRGYPIGIVANVEKEFHQIVVKPDDRNMLKFLWFDDIESPKPQIVQYRFCYLVFSLTPSQTILTETINHHIICYLMTEHNIAEILANEFYADDFKSGTQTIEKGFNLYQKAK